MIVKFVDRLVLYLYNLHTIYNNMSFCFSALSLCVDMSRHCSNNIASVYKLWWELYVLLCYVGVSLSVCLVMALRAC